MVNELLLSRLLASLTVRRTANLLKTGVSFFISALFKKNIVWGIPSVLTIEPTNLCNLQCPLCTTGSGEMERIRGKMTLNTFQNIINKLGDDIFFLLIYHQGEPYINKHFFDFVRLAKEKNIYVTTSTNGHFFTPTNIDKTLACGLDSMIISLDGTTQTSYQYYRVGGKLERVIDGTRSLIRERKGRKQRTPNIVLQFLVMKHNETEIPEIRRIAKEIGVDRLLIKNIEVRSVEEARKWLPQDDAYRRYNFDGSSLIVKDSQKESCPRPWLSTLINWDGSFVPCCFDKNGLYPMGNINHTHSIRDIWLGENFKSFREKLIRDRKKIDICRNCNQGFGSFLPNRRWKQGK
jgi:radical SAM protein with 4Fe4S-binding SPASM domain